MSDINSLNERTRQEKVIQLRKREIEDIGSKLSALLIALHVLPPEERNKVIAAFEQNYEDFTNNRQPEKEEVCEYCTGTGEISTDVDDGEGHVMQGVGDKQKCICQIKE